MINFNDENQVYTTSILSLQPMRYLIWQLNPTNFWS